MQEKDNLENCNNLNDEFLESQKQDYIKNCTNICLTLAYKLGEIYGADWVGILKEYIRKYGKRYSCGALSLIMLITMASSSKRKNEQVRMDYTAEYKNYYQNNPFMNSKMNMNINILEFERPEEIIEEVEPTFEEKVEWILENHGLTYEELDMVCAGAVAESGHAGYLEGYSVACVYVNRLSNLWCVREYGPTVYDQFVAPGQFTVYAMGYYKAYLGRTDLPEYQGAIDMLYYMEPNHNYISFKSHNYDLTCAYEYMTERGNKYHQPLPEIERMDNELVLARAKKDQN